MAAPLVLTPPQGPAPRRTSRLEATLAWAEAEVLRRNAKWRAWRAFLSIAGAHTLTHRWHSSKVLDLWLQFTLRCEACGQEGKWYDSTGGRRPQLELAERKAVRSLRDIACYHVRELRYKPKGFEELVALELLVGG